MREVRDGMSKARSAIENSLSKNLDFMEMRDIIREIVKDPGIDLGYEYSPGSDNIYGKTIEDKNLPQIDEQPESSDEEPLPKPPQSPIDFFGMKKSPFQEVPLVSSNVTKFMGVKKPLMSADSLLSKMKGKIQSAKQSVIKNQKMQKKKYNASEIR